MNPPNLFYTKQHEWVRVEGDTGTIGITDHAQQELGDIVFVETPKIGSAIEQGAVIGSIESVKAVSEMFSPVSGEVSEVNPILQTNPEKVNEDPYGEGWIAKMKLSNPGETKSLLSAEDYQKYAGEESGH
ncbi:MAG: glycine cleavage system protein GcvH [Acidobacteriota bacterium]|jgi:glycine cleavage system H protein|nr:glycine cleavage system protein GcvH [Acidobacteriota bacterium]